MFQIQGYVVPVGAVAQGVPLVRVEDDTVLVDFHKSRAFVGRSFAQHFGQMLRVGVDGAGHKGSFGGQGQGDGVDRRLNRAHRGGFRDRTHFGCGGGLPLRQTVDAVVEEDNFHIHIAAQGVDQVVAADGESVAVAGDDPNVQVRVGDGQPRCQGGRAAVDAVNAVGVHIIGEAAGTANARNKDNLLFGHAQFRHHPLHLGQNRIIAAARTPAHSLVRDKILAGQCDFIRRCCTHNCFAHCSTPCPVSG